MMSTMKLIEDPSAVDAPVGSEGGRSPSALSTGQAAPAPGVARTALWRLASAGVWGASASLFCA